MATLKQLLGRTNNCTDEQDAQQCFAYDSSESQEPSCDDWKNGFECNSSNILKKLNWLFNKITCALKAHEQSLENNPGGGGNTQQKKQWFMANHISQNDITFPTNTAFDDIKFGQVKQGDSSTGYGYNPSTGQFKAEHNGLYLFTFNANVSFTANGSTKSLTGMVYKQSLVNAAVNIYFANADVTDDNVSATVQLRLNKDDVVSVRFQKFNVGDDVKILTKSSNEQPYFHGHLIHELPEEISGPLG